jgi:tetratricopeptide (TPR) repeat protein
MLKKFGFTFLLITLSSAYAWALTDADLYYRAGNTMYLRGAHLLSIPFYKAAINGNPQNWQAYQALGGSEFRVGNVDEALRDYKMSLQINSTNTELQNFVNQISNVPTLPKPGQVISQDSKNMYYRAGNMLYLNHVYILAVPYYQAVLEADRYNWKAYQALGGCEFRMGRIDDAIRDYKLSLAINPDNKPLKEFLDRLMAQPNYSFATGGNGMGGSGGTGGGSGSSNAEPVMSPAALSAALLGTAAPPVAAAPPAAKAAITPVAAAPKVNPTPAVTSSTTPLPAAAAAAPSADSAPPMPKAADDYHLPHQGSMTWELMTGFTFNGSGDITNNYAGISPLVVNTASVAPIAADFDFGADYTVNPNLQLGAQFQFISKQNLVIYQPYNAIIGGSSYLATNTTTWSEACLGGVLDGKYLLSLNNDFRLIFNGQAGYYSLVGSSYVNQGSTLTTLNLNGSSLGGLVETKIEWILDQGGWALDLGLGYRILSFNTITYTNASNNQSQVLTNGNGGNVTFDFSGPRVSLAARFF